MQFLATALLCISTLIASGDVLAAEAKHVDTPIDDFTLKSQFGKDYSLHDFADRDAVVVVFLGTECPLAKLYATRLTELAAKWDEAKVAVLAIDSNQQDSIQEIAAFASRHDMEFPVLKDPGNVVADRFQATRTPEVFVLDRDRVVRYHGRIDDQYGFADGVGFQKPAPTRNDLETAISELLAGTPVSVAETDVLGCFIGRVRDVNEKSDVTYSNQIARIFQNHCIECHREGRIGPFVMTSYEEVVGWGEMIREVVDQGRMPPWHANPKYGHFKNDLRLSDEEKQLLRTWVDNGCPQGDPSQLPPPKEFVEGWAIGEPDQIVYMRDEPMNVPAEGVIDYYHFVVDPGWTEDKWIMAAEAKPGSVETVHHILVFVQPPVEGARGRFGRRTPQADSHANNDSPQTRGRSSGRTRGGRGEGGGGIGGGNLIAGYAPGMNPMLSTDGTTAMHVKAGSKLIFQLHYTPNGSTQQDRSFVGFRFTDPEKVTHVARSTAVANAFFSIPPGAADYQAQADRKTQNDTIIANLTPHMHTRGKAFCYEVTYPDGTHEILLDVPHYDFNWQTTYELSEPKRIPKGSTLLCTAHWDNSEENLSNPDPTKRVTWGDQTWEEMMIGFYVEVYPKDEVPVEPSGGRAFGGLDPDKIFASLDANSDGKLTSDELPDQLANRVGLADVNGDGGISKEELTNLIKLFSGRANSNEE